MPEILEILILKGCGPNSWQFFDKRWFDFVNKRWFGVDFNTGTLTKI